MRTLCDADLAEGLTVSARDGPVFVAWQERGVPDAMPSEDQARGVSIGRAYLTLEEEPASAFRHGDLILVRLTVRSALPLQNLVIADLLPRGLEIEEASLATRQDEPTTVSAGIAVKAAQPQEDRMVLCADVWQTTPVVYECHARAVTRATRRLSLRRHPVSMYCVDIGCALLRRSPKRARYP